MPLIAHKRKSDNFEQSIALHSRNVARLCSASMARMGFAELGYLAGLLHDLGKCTVRWQTYFLDRFYGRPTVAKGDVHHAPTGAVFAFERWYCGQFAEKAAAQIMAMAIYGHHGGLMDAFRVDGTSALLEKMAQNKDELCCDEAMENFFREVCTPEELDSRFRQAAAEIEKKRASIDAFSAGLLMRALLGALVDADRWDSACFEFGEDPFTDAAAPDWAAAFNALERKLAEFPSDTPLAGIRAEISNACLSAAERRPGIFTLTVPTGGGKTLSSLRFALRHAEMNGQNHVFYIIPFNTILDQNSRDIRNTLGETVTVLEHHSNVVFDEKTSDDEIENYRLLTERWRSDLVLTSMVQFLNAFYSASNTDARRLCALTNSVIIFDEVQALPKKCTKLFEKAIRFLANFCGCTVVLCTATQPQLLLDTTEIMPDTQELFASLRRTRLIDETGVGKSVERAASDLARLIQKHGSVLMIVNTKRMAHRLYESVRQSGVACVHLSTDMYPEHRLRLIDEIKNRPVGEPFFCVSTALIEAGINISFPCVVRSLTGLGSILQAAGRCNRNAELPDGTLGEVHIWRLSEERLIGLPEIAGAQECSVGLLTARGASAADAPESIAEYYAIERKYFDRLLPYPARADGIDVTLLDILGCNGHVSQNEARKLALCGAYRTAEKLFRVISSDTTQVLVERDRGEALAAELAGDPPMAQKLRLLREAQRYSLSLFSPVFSTLLSEGAIWKIESSGVYVLRKEHYDPETGLTMAAQIMEDLQY